MLRLVLPSARILPACLVVLSAPAAAQSSLPPVTFPPGNPFSTSKARLGKTLFWDEQLSSARTVACGTCHLPSAGGADPRSLGGDAAGAIHPGADGLFGTADDVAGSPGVVARDPTGAYLGDDAFPLVPRVTGRRAPSVINAAFSSFQFWDGRAGTELVDPLTGQTALPLGASLETQVLAPPLSDVEMGHVGRDWDDVVARLGSASPLALSEDPGDELAEWIAGRGYPELFAEAFGTPEITPVRLAMAIATYERTLVSDQAPIDAFLAGDVTAISGTAQLGFDVFTGKGRCALCHPPPLFATSVFVNIGLRPAGEDLGRFLVTGQPFDRGAFKVPSLRNVALRAPFFHHGGVTSLSEVVEFYDRGGDFGAEQSPLIQPLGLLPIEKVWLVDFLLALTDPRVTAASPPFDRPRLLSESPSRRPEVLPPGEAGSEGVVPRMVAREAALLGAGGITVGVDDVLGGAPVFLGLSLSRSDPPLSIQGMPFHLGPAGPNLVLHLVGTARGVDAGQGWLSFTDGLPDDPAAAGMEIVAQWFVLDLGAPLGVAASPGARFPVFGAD